MSQKQKHSRLDTAASITRRVKDSGWILMRTAHGPRFHREIGKQLQLDVEPQISTWLATITADHVVRNVLLGHRSQQEAAKAIESVAGIPTRMLPTISAAHAARKENHV